MTTTEKINRIRSNDKANEIIEKLLGLLEEIQEYTDLNDGNLDATIDKLAIQIGRKYNRNQEESKNLSKEIINN